MIAGLCAGPQGGGSQPAAHPEASAAPAPWTIVPSPDVAGDLRSDFNGAWCADQSDCWVVGAQYSATDYPATLIERWDGTSWSITPSSGPSGEVSSTLYGVTCAASSDCWAVGDWVYSGGSALLIEHWDGTAWTISSAPGPNGALTSGLDGVSCVTEDDCWAAGFDYTNGFGTLLEHWDGTAWSTVNGPGSDGSEGETLSAVSCAASDQCFAVGNANPAGTAGAIIEQWNGSTWNVDSAQVPVTAASSTLQGLTCRASFPCFAVGDYTLTNGTAQPLIEQWNGTAWTQSTVSDASPLDAESLLSVDCESASSCYAAGSLTPPGGSTAPVVEAWNGSTWASAGVTAPTDAQTSQLSGLGCGAGICVASGVDNTTSGFETGLIDGLTNGSWGQQTPQHPQAENVNAPSALTCVADDSCFAVGSHTTGAVADTLVEHWDGSAWTVMSSPSVSNGLNSFLDSVTCVSADECWAAGMAENNDASEADTLMEEWDGSSWKIVSTPDPEGAQFSALLGVSCIDPTTCWAVGDTFAGSSATQSVTQGSVGPAQTLIEQWNGSGWQIVMSPDTSPADDNVLNAVTCLPIGDCWAVGYAEGASTYSGITLHYAAGSWQSVTSPAAASGTSYGLFGVTCLSDTACTAVGYSYPGSGGAGQPYATWVQGWNGTSWTAVASPNSSTEPVNALFSVACSSADDCWTVGTAGNDYQYYILTEHWNGTAWTVVQAQDPATATSDRLQSVACVSGTCWAGGNFNDTDGTLQNLIEVNGALPPAPVPEGPAVPLLLFGVCTCALFALRHSGGFSKR